MQVTTQDVDCHCGPPVIHSIHGGSGFRLIDDGFQKRLRGQTFVVVVPSIAVADPEPQDIPIAIYLPSLKRVHWNGPIKRWSGAYQPPAKTA